MKDTKALKIFLTSLLLTSLTTATSIASAGNTGKLSLGDGAIIAIYNQVNTFDIETAGLGLANAKDAQVIELAKMVQKDHTAVRNMAAELATKLGKARSLPASRAKAAAEHAKILQTLSSKKGAEFDQAFLAHEIQFHTNAISAINTVLIPAATNDELVALMKKVLPGFEHHLAETMRVSKVLGYQ